MKIIKQKDALVFRKQGKTLDVLAREYPMGNPDLNIAEVIIRGRYPEKGWAVNRVSTMMVYILSGTVRIAIKGKRPETLTVGDAVEIQAGEEYSLDPDGVVRLLPASTPAWTPEQHQTVE
ncbi:MAG TPA: hypothetical protein VMR73_00510 [Candidatus Paceibacterota bacterium]|nr:hypothetical protein [Candidatus Paceibacterota bacterium]